MEMLAFNLFLLIFLFPMNELSFVQDDQRDINILKKMKFWGKAVKKNYLPETLSTKKQFIVVAILSNKFVNDKDILDEQKLETDCPQKKIQIHTYQCRTSAVIFNENLMGNDQRLANLANAEDFQSRMNNSGCKRKAQSEWHGEIILIHGGVLKELISNFWDDVGGDDTAQCHVYLYSYNIPCAKIKNTPYSCSEEIMLYNKKTHNNDTPCIIKVIGYTRVYDMFPNSKTDENQAKKWLLEGGAVELYNMQQEIRIRYVPPENNGPMEGKKTSTEERRKRLASSELKINNDNMIFQDLVYICLNNTPLPFCCLSDLTDNIRRQKIISFFVNKMSYYCTYNSRERGSISPHSLPDLKNCFSSWLQDNVGSECRICSDGSLQSAWYQQYIVAFCIDGIMDWTTTFGRPSKGWDLTNPAWVPWNGPWNNMYLESVRSFQSGINLFCENRMLDIGSMCTKMTTKTIRKQRMKNLLIDKNMWH